LIENDVTGRMHGS